MIKIENLSKKYGNKEAVKGISFEVKEGEMLALLGGNGAENLFTKQVIK